jgi:hypothetical protein
MRTVIAILVLCVVAPVYPQAFRISRTKDLVAPPVGATLPVRIDRTLKPHNLQVGQAVTGELMQTVPVSTRNSLPEGAKLEGRVVSVGDKSISILFDQLRWKDRTLPVHVRLIAAAAPNNVYETKAPLGATDRATSNPNDWTTRQVGGDEVYLSGGSGKVYDRYSQPVGYADFSGVYASPPSPDQPPRAIGPFSSTASGLHGFPALSIVSAGGTNAPITLASTRPNWQIGNGSAFLFEVVR